MVFTVSIKDVSAADGDTIYVNGSGGNDSNNGYTWNTAKLTISNATGTVNVNGLVNIADGSYSGVNNTNITLDKNMTIQGQSKENTIINGTDSSKIFIITNGVTVNFLNLTLTNGRDDFGAAIEMINSCSSTVTNCIFSNNNATDQGAIYISWGCSLIVTDSTFTNNRADNDGGAILNYGTLTLTGSTLTGNTAKRGGAIYNDGTANVHFNRIVGNTATDNGGAIWNNQETINALYNWWSSNSGPTTGSLYGVTTEKYTPWLIMTVSASPTTIYSGGTSTITVDFTHDSNGGVHDPALGHFPDNTGVTITSTGGEVGSFITTAYTNNGAATTPFRATLGPGTGLAAGSLDNQTPLSVNINILQAPTVNAASTTSTKTIGMQTTGAPIMPLALAVLSLLGGLAATRKKQ